MNNLYTVVMSAWRANNDLIANMEASKAMRAHLDSLGLAHWDAVGAYKEDGEALYTQEVSHIIHCGAADVSALKDYAAREHKQDCILVIKSADNSARLEFPSESMNLGHLYKVDKNKALANGAYTYFLGDYYICSHTLESDN